MINADVIESSNTNNVEKEIAVKRNSSTSSIRAFVAKSQYAFDDEFNRTLHVSQLSGVGKVKADRNPSTVFMQQDLKLEHVLKRREFIGVKKFKNDDDSNLNENSITSSMFMNFIGPILSPIRQFDMIFIIWIEFITFCALLSAFLTPYRLAFESDAGPKSASFAFELFIDSMFCFNTFIHCIHVVPTNLLDLFSDNRNTMSSIFSFEGRKAIFINYVTDKKIFFRLICAVPWDFLVDAIHGSTLNVHARFGLGLLRIFRWIYIDDAFRNAERNVRYPYFIIRLVKFLLLFLFESHFFACVFYFVAFASEAYEETWIHSVDISKPSGFPPTASGRYLISIYWSVTTMATVGYGDITAQAPAEYVITFVYIIFNLFLSSFVIGNMTLLVTQAYEIIRVFRMKFSNLETFMDMNRLPDSLRESLRSYIILKFNVEKEHREVLDEFPLVFKSRVCRYLYSPTINVSFFANVASEAFQDALSSVLHLELLMPSTDAVSQYDASFEMFIVVSGVCEMFLDTSYASSSEAPDDISPGDKMDEEIDNIEEASIPRSIRGSTSNSLYGNKNKKKKAKKRKTTITIATLGQGDCFGEVAFFFSQKQLFTVRTLSICRLLALKREGWETLKSMYPQDARLVQQEVARRLRLTAASFDSMPLSQSIPSVTSECDIEPSNTPLPPDNTPLSSVDRMEVKMVYDTIVKAVNAEIANKEQDKVAELCLAAASGNFFAMRQITFGGFDVNTSDYDDRTALHVAAAKGAAESIDYLLQKGANVNSVDCFGVTPLFEAVRNGHTAAADVLFRAGGTLGLSNKNESASVNAQKDEGTLMCTVASNADMFYLQRLLAYGLSADSCDYDGRTGLHVAAASGHYSVIECLLSNGAYPSPLDRFGRTPLLEAVRASQEPCARLLHSKGAQFKLLVSIDARTEEKDAPVAQSATSQSTEDLRIPEPNNNLDDQDNITAIQKSATSIHPTNNYNDFNRQKYEETLIVEEGGWGYAEGIITPKMVDFIPFQRTNSELKPHLSHPIITTTHMVTSNTKTLTKEEFKFDDTICSMKSRLLAGLELCLASYESDISYLRLLLKFGCPVNAGDYDGRTAAHICCAENLLPAALTLFEFNADFVSDAVRDRWGHTPLEEAINNKNFELAAALQALLNARSAKQE